MTKKKLTCDFKTAGLVTMGIIGGAALGAADALKRGTPVLSGMAVGAVLGATGGLSYGACYAATGRPIISYFAAGLVSTAALMSAVYFGASHELITAGFKQYMPQNPAGTLTFAQDAAMLASLYSYFAGDKPSPQSSQSPIRKPRVMGRQFPSLSR